jgi:hypothetical protein
VRLPLKWAVLLHLLCLVAAELRQSRLLCQLEKAQVLGFVSGAGAGEGTLGDRAEEGLFGATMGFVATPALQLTGRVTGKAYRSVVDGMFASPNRLGKDAARDAIKSALEADAGTVDQAIAIVLSKAGKPYSLADVGPNTRAYLDAANVLTWPRQEGR